MRVSREAARRFRLAAQGLDERGGDHLGAAAPGLRNTPAGAYADALAARVEEVREDGLVAIWGPRAAPYVVAAEDVGTFTRGGFPLEERSAKAYAPSAVKTLGEGRPLLEAIGEVEVVMRAAVADGPVERDAMHQRLREALPGELLWWCRGCGSHHVHPMLWRGACALGGLRRFDPAGHGAVVFAAVEEPPRPQDDAAARAELLRRTLHHHGPLTKQELTRWLQLSAKEVAGRLEAVAGELEEVDREGERALALRADLDALADPPPVTGVRLLGPGDPLLDGRDRATLVPDPDREKEVWKILANPGVVLHDGQVVGTWRGKASRGALEVRATAFAPLPDLTGEAERVAAARGLSRARVI